MEPKVEQLGEQRFLVTISEGELPCGAASICRPLPASFPTITLVDLREQYRIIEWNLVEQAKRLILSDTHVGEWLKALPKRSNIKHKIITDDDELGFIVRFFDKGHAALFKLAFS